MTITTVTAYQTSDGNIHKSEAAAIDHQRELDIADGLQDFSDKFFYSGMSASDVVSILTENEEALLKCFGK